MITQKTAARIWECYREIAAGEKLLVDMEKARKDDPLDPSARNLRDAFGRRRELHLGVPSGESAHQLFGVSPDLAESVIRAHIQRKRTALVEANEQARIELNADLSVSVVSEPAAKENEKP